MFECKHCGKSTQLELTKSTNNNGLIYDDYTCGCGYKTRLVHTKKHNAAAWLFDSNDRLVQKIPYPTM